LSSIHVPRLKIPVSERDHIQGSSAKVTLLEYGDYQCPYCGEAYSIVKRVQQKFDGDLRFVFRNFPVTEIHPFAEFGAQIAESAGAGGKFWEMHDYLYEHQPYLANPDFFIQYASTGLGLNGEKVREDVTTHAYTSRIREDFISGVRSGVNGTPTFFINELRHNGDYQYDTLVEAVGAAMGSKTRAVKKPATARVSRSRR